jgi:hypothetical protein
MQTSRPTAAKVNLLAIFVEFDDCAFNVDNFWIFKPFLLKVIQVMSERVLRPTPYVLRRFTQETGQRIQ